MKKKYSLDFSIVHDYERLQAVCDILDQLEKDPSPTELEQMASYILYGKDENGQNSIQRNETIDKDKRYKSYKTKDDKMQSLDEIMEMPGFDEQQLRSAYKRDAYTVPKPCINRPKYDKKTGEMIDPGDSDVPGMIEQWEIIDRWQRILDVAQGKVAPTESDIIITDPYHIYQLKHNLIDIRRHQYYLKDSYKPTIHFQNLDHPKTQFYDWSGDSFYWISREQWQNKVNHAYTSRVSKNLKDYETRGEGDNLEVKWIICEHNFDWENFKHVRALINHYRPLYEYLKEKLDTYGRTLIWDLERYIELCDFTPARRLMLELRLNQYTVEEISAELEHELGLTYNLNHLSSIIAVEIPKRIATIARTHRLLCETPPEKRYLCTTCQRTLPLDTIFFARNSARATGFSNICKECDRKKRLQRKGGTITDDRFKDKKMSKV